MTTRVVVLNPDDFELSQDAREFQAQPAFMPMVEDIYSIQCTTSWFVVYTDPNREGKVSEGLNELKVESLFPKTVEWKPRTRAERDQKKPLQPIERPLMPRYGYVRLPNCPQAFAAVQGLDGVRTILGHGERKIPVPASQVEFFREQEAAGVFNKTIKRGRVVAPKWAVEGTPVRITSGPFADFIGVIERCLKKDQVKIALSLFGRDTSTEMGLSGVEPAS